MDNLSLEALKGHLFETLEGVKNLSDSSASENEKTSIDQARAIVDISGKIIDIYKTQLSAVELADRIGSFGKTMGTLTAIGAISESEAKKLNEE